jgi:PadR family transcriptional regulator PadR
MATNSKRTGSGAASSADGASDAADGADGARRPRLHGDLLVSSLLAMLRNFPAYGYQLVQELGKAGLPAFDSATVYRTLRQLERSGMVSSFWDTSESGPARRMYSLTTAGEAFLGVWLDVLSHYQNILQSALDSYDNRGARGTSGGPPKDKEPKRSRKGGRHA